MFLMVCATSAAAGHGGYSITRVSPRFAWFPCKAIWVEPKQSCVIAYDSIDENGALQKPIFKKWEVPKKPAEPK